MDDFKLNFLVHPGYWLLNRKLGENITKSSLEPEKKLLRVYREKLDNLGDSDVLVIFAPALKSSFLKMKSDFERKLEDGLWGAVDVLKNNRWLALVKRAEDKLGNRCLTFANPNFLPPFIDDALKSPGMKDVDEELKKRGFHVKQDTSCEVWGTSLSEKDSACVVNTAEQVWRWFELENFPSIPVEATNRFDLSNTEFERLSVDLEKNRPHAHGALKRNKLA